MSARRRENEWLTERSINLTVWSVSCLYESSLTILFFLLFLLPALIIMSAVCTSTAPPKLQLRSFGFYPSGLVSGEEQISLNDDDARQDRKSNKPLPHIPQDTSITLNGTGDSRPPVTKPDLRPTPVSPASPHKATSFLSFYSYTKSSTKMLETFQTSPILAALLAHLDWVDAYSLFATCKTFREVLKELQLRDVVLSRFVPGYAHAMKGRDMSKYHDVPVSIHDLDLLGVLFYAIFLPFD